MWFELNQMFNIEGTARNKLICIFISVYIFLCGVYHS